MEGQVPSLFLLPELQARGYFSRYSMILNPTMKITKASAAADAYRTPAESVVNIIRTIQTMGIARAMVWKSRFLRSVAMCPSI